MMLYEAERIVGIVSAEWTKARSTRTLLRHVVAGIVLSVGIAALIAIAMGQANEYCAQPGHSCESPPMSADNLIATAGVMGDGTPGAGLIAMMLLGASCVLTEYRYGTFATAFFATPQRWRIVAAKVGVVGIVAFGAILLAAMISSVVFALLGGTAADSVEPWSVDTALIALRTAIVVAFAAAGSIGIAAALRNSMAVIALIVVWPLVIEPLLPSMLPGSADAAVGLMPFANARHFIGLNAADVEFFWGGIASGAYFAVVMAGVVAAGIAVTERVNVR